MLRVAFIGAPFHLHQPHFSFVVLVRCIIVIDSFYAFTVIYIIIYFFLFNINSKVCVPLAINT